MVMNTSDVRASIFKRNKILATIGPASNNYEMIHQLMKNGANGFRLNFSHGTYDERVEQVRLIRKISEELSKPVAIVQDLQGPKIRLGDFEGTIHLKAGESFSLKYKSKYPKEKHLPIQYDISKRVEKGQSILLNDGRVRASVVSTRSGVVMLRAENEGSISSRKGVNLPETDFSGDIITAKDRQDIKFGATLDIDYVALSFVQSADDIKNLRRLLDQEGSNAKIIAKIETNTAAKNLEPIVEVADAIMVARGDLALEIRPEAVPIIQRDIITLALKHKKISIVATQMLGSMTNAPEPTRAEVSDVATAVLLGADCVMLSEETASGNYPAESVAMMKRIILYAQPNTEEIDTIETFVPTTIQDSIATAVIQLAKQTGAAAIVANTKTGATALSISSLRPSVPIAIVTADKKISQQLSLVYGSKSYRRREGKNATSLLTDFMLEEKVLAKGDIIVSASGQQPGISGATDTIKVRKLT